MRNAVTPERELRSIQQSFAAQIRGLGGAMPPGVEPDRMAVYRELFRNNIESFLAESFPVLHQLLSPRRWQAMVDDFYARHACGSPLFTRLGEEFIGYLRQERGRVPGDPPYLLELAHYEWVELGLALSEAEAIPATRLSADRLRDSELRLSPLAWPLRYRHAVHRLGTQGPEAGEAQGPAHLLVYRNAEERVVFLEIDAPAYALLSALQTLGTVSARDLLQTLAELVGEGPSQPFIDHGMALIGDLQQRGVIAATPCQRGEQPGGDGRGPSASALAGR